MRTCHSLRPVHVQGPPELSFLSRVKSCRSCRAGGIERPNFDPIVDIFWGSIAGSIEMFV